MTSLRKLYFYGCDDTQDHGWGCVYRCVQSVLSEFPDNVLSVPSIPDIARIIGKNIHDPVLKNRWIEPHNTIPVFERYGLTIDLYWYCIYDKYPPGVYTEITKLTNLPVPSIVDDGTYGYVITKHIDGSRYMAMDPHKTGAPLFELDMGTRSLWMIGHPRREKKNPLTFTQLGHSMP